MVHLTESSSAFSIRAEPGGPWAHSSAPFPELSSELSGESSRKDLKSVDLTLNWDAEPVVDELASTPLDVIARERGDTKIAPNPAGI